MMAKHWHWGLALHCKMVTDKELAGAKKKKKKKERALADTGKGVL